MAGHVEDRWYRDSFESDTGKPVLNAKGKPVQEKTDLHGKGMRYRVRYYNAEGKERSRSFPDRNLEKAKAFLTKMQHDVLAGVFVDPTAGDETFRSHTEKWRRGQSQDVSTKQTVDSRLNAQVYPFLGDKPLRVVEKPDTIREWLEWMRSKGTKTSYRSQIFDLVAAIVQAARDEDKIRSNPFNAKSIKKPKADFQKIVPWQECRVHALMAALPGNYKIIVPLGAGTALRQMEIFGLGPDDLDAENMELHVVRQIRWIGGQAVFAPPKGGKNRVVPLASGVLRQVQEYQENYEPVELTLPWLEPGGDLLTARVLVNFKDQGLTRLGRPRERQVWRGGNFTSEIWQPAFTAAGLTYRGRLDGMHAMRHFCASYWLAHGVSIKEVAEYLGHHDPGYTLRIYTHLVPSSHRRARLAIDNVFTPRAGSPDADDSSAA
ncbi:site-specific integrase [Actinosynnema sp. NPDC020468]|uniref:tyrosine-type recombinase/integrase n=1 Tax=Actinosynnema sp. NPDC020468 TaxID=3154488 RepID=UPI0033E5F3AA